MVGDSEKPVIVEQNGPVTELVLNRPATMNAIDDELAESLKASLAAVARNPRCRCLVITGTGRGFCSGQVLPDARAGNELPADIAGLVRQRYVPIISMIRGLGVPVVAAVNGPAAGAGLSLALAADIRVASDNAWFSCGFSQIGLVPDAGASYFLPRLLGLSRALEFAVSGARMAAAQALELGLVSRVVRAADFASDYRQFAAELAAAPTRAFALTKRAFSEALGSTLFDQMELEAELQQAASETADFREGLRAFQEKRTPHFQGH
ncbi:MAG: enoyl-CoA hydratase-related protein [Candidatus Dormibacteria bacterium]